MSAELALYQKKARLIIGGSIMAIMTVGVAIMAVLGPNPDSVFRPFRSPAMVYGFGIAGVVLGIWITWFAVRSLLNPKPRVVLSENGVVVDGFSGHFSASWSDLSGYSVKNGSNIVLLLKDLDGFIARLGAGRAQQTAKALSERFGSPFLIETSMLATDRETVESYLRGHIGKVGA